MAKSHFAIERPRKISISIDGYNAQAQTLAQQRKQQDRRRRIRRKTDAAAKRQRVEHPESAQPSPAALPEPAQRQHDSEDIEALNRAAATQPLTDDVERELLAAFADGEGAHANE